MSITEKDVEHIANLSRLELAPEEKLKFTRQLGQILDYAEKLKDLDTGQITPTAHAIPIATLFREDSPRLSPEREDILNNAPDRSGDFFAVPRILEEEA